jgi:hypothetical protein
VDLSTHIIGQGDLSLDSLFRLIERAAVPVYIVTG